MFVGREKELAILKQQFDSDRKTAILVYGKRRIGKSTLLLKAAETFDGIVINHLCVQSTYEGNMDLLSRSICQGLEFPSIRFEDLYALFDFLNKQDKKILLIIDEYQYLKNTKKAREIDSLMQSVIDRMSNNINVVLCGSYITIMRELLEEENPLFGRFTAIIHLNEFDYYDAAKFYPQSSIRRKVENYAVFGGSPYVLSNIDSNISLEQNIIHLLLPETGILRSYIENVILREIQKTFDTRILEIIGNGKKKYSEINSMLGISNGLLDKQLKNLMNMETISKVSPINKPNDKRKTFYIINDNLMRFYFTYIFGNAGIIERIGEETFFKQFISASIQEFVSRRFEDIGNQYFQRKAKEGKILNVVDIGSFWYDDSERKISGEFDCVLKRTAGYDFYECKFYKEPMKVEECKKEEMQVNQIKGLSIHEMGFICLGGFDFQTDEYKLVSGEMLFE